MRTEDGGQPRSALGTLRRGRVKTEDEGRRTAEKRVRRVTPGKRERFKRAERWFKRLKVWERRGERDGQGKRGMRDRRVTPGKQGKDSGNIDI